jgi:hypothetical protein
MTLRSLTIAFAAMLGACLAGPLDAATPARDNGLQLIDLTDDFDRVWTETRDLPDQQRVDAFETRFAKILPGFYSADRAQIKDFMTPEKYRAFVLKGLKTYPEQREGIQRVSGEFASLIAPAQKSFEKAFGPMLGYPPVYLVISFGEFDGGTRDLPEGTRLMFGADVIAKLYKDKPIQPFLHHELFHILHHRTFQECDTVWCNLWSEGLAVYVASQLNPGASDASLLLTYPSSLRDAVEAHRTEALCAVRGRLNSTDPKDAAPLFIGGSTPLSPNLPPRFAYYVGYVVAQDLGRTRSLKQLAAMKNDEVRPLVEQSLARMTSCMAASERG